MTTPTLLGTTLALSLLAGTAQSAVFAYDTAADFATAVKAGTIASSNGRPRGAPTPRRNVRRGNACLVTIMSVPFPLTFCHRATSATVGDDTWPDAAIRI